MGYGPVMLIGIFGNYIQVKIIKMIRHRNDKLNKCRSQLLSLVETTANQSNDDYIDVIRLYDFSKIIDTLNQIYPDSNFSDFKIRTLLLEDGRVKNELFKYRVNSCSIYLDKQINIYDLPHPHKEYYHMILSKTVMLLKDNKPISTIIIALVVAYLIYLFGWNGN